MWPSSGRRHTNGEDCHGTSETGSRTSADTGPPTGRIRAVITFNNCMPVISARAGGQKFQKLFAYRKVSGVGVRVIIVCYSIN